MDREQLKYYIKKIRAPPNKKATINNLGFRPEYNMSFLNLFSNKKFDKKEYLSIYVGQRNSNNKFYARICTETTTEDWLIRDQKLIFLLKLYPQDDFYKNLK